MTHITIKEQMIEGIWKAPTVHRYSMSTPIKINGFTITHFYERTVFVKLKPSFAKLPITFYNVGNLLHEEMISYIKNLTNPDFSLVYDGIPYIDIRVVPSDFDTSLYLNSNDKFNDFIFMQADNKVHLKIKLML